MLEINKTLKTIKIIEIRKKTLATISVNKILFDL